MPQAETPEGMVNLAHALVETQHLRGWFYALERLPASFRETAFSEMAAQMRNAGEDSELADAVASLANPKMYQSVLETVRERVGDTTPDTLPNDELNRPVAKSPRDDCRHTLR